MTVEPVKWVGRCDRCDEPAPEERDNYDAAQRDVDECPCLSDCPAPTDAEILAYHKAEIEPLLFSGIPADVQDWYRRRYVTDVRANPVALRQIVAYTRGEIP